MKPSLITLILVLTIVIGGCATSYTLIEPGKVNYSDLNLATSQAWNLGPRQLSPALRENSVLWTQDGPGLDRILIIPAIPSGEPIFKQKSDEQALPLFKPDMGPKEIEELTESSVVKLMGEGQVAVETSNLRPHRFGGDKGFLFDLEMAVTDGPDYGGVAGAFVNNNRLYLIIYLAAKPHYYEKHLDEALNVIRGASV